MIHLHLYMTVILCIYHVVRKNTLIVYCRAMLCKRAIMRCLSVRLSVTFIHSVKTNKDIFEIFTASGSDTILFFPCQTPWQYSDGTPTPRMGRRMQVGSRVGRNRDSEPISGFIACCAVKRSSGKCNTLSCNEPCRVYNTRPT